MFTYAVLVLAVAAVVGLYMAVGHFRGQTPPSAGVAILHGLLAVTGVVLVLLGVMEIGWGSVHSWALGIFVVAALGGLFLVSHHLRGKPLPGSVVVIHGMVAAIAFLILLTAVFLIP